MSKSTWIAAAVMFMAIVSVAQQPGNDSRDTPTFGFKAGANYSNIYDTKGDAFNSDPKFGFVTGVFIAIPIGRYLGVQPEILYSQKGYHAKGTLFANDYQLTRKTSYIDVPILLALKPARFLTILAGPQYSFLISKSDEFTSGSLSIEQKSEFEKGNLRENIFCFLGGIDINPNHFVFAPRIGWDMMHNNGDGTSTSPRYKNVWYQAAIGYRF